MNDDATEEFRRSWLRIHATITIGDTVDRATVSILKTDLHELDLDALEKIVHGLCRNAAEAALAKATEKTDWCDPQMEFPEIKEGGRPSRRNGARR